jgi:hypothetical protein
VPGVALRLAVRLAPNRPEPHFNLGLVYERRGMRIEAEQEMLASPRLEPGQLDAVSLPRVDHTWVSWTPQSLLPDRFRMRRIG